MTTITNERRQLKRSNPPLNWLGVTDKFQLADLMEDDTGEYIDLCGTPLNLNGTVINPDPEAQRIDYSGSLEIRKVDTSTDGSIAVDVAVTIDEDTGLLVGLGGHILTKAELDHVLTLDTDTEHFILKKLPANLGREQLYVYGSGHSD